MEDGETHRYVCKLPVLLGSDRTRDKKRYEAGEIVELGDIDAENLWNLGAIDFPTGKDFVRDIVGAPEDVPEDLEEPQPSAFAKAKAEHEAALAKRATRR